MNFPALLAQLIETAVPAIDHAAQAGDRWLFLAALSIIILGGAAAIRWLVSSLTAKDKAGAEERATLAALHAAERAALVAEIKSEHLECRQARKEDQALFLDALGKKDAVLTGNTKAVESLVLTVTRHDADMRAAHEVELKTIIRGEIEKQRNK